MKLKKTFSFILNILLFVLELGTFINLFQKRGGSCMAYYTEDSNFLLLIASFISIILQLIGKESKWANEFYLISVATTSMTFLFVLFVLAPVGDIIRYWGTNKPYFFGYKTLVFDGTNHYLHFLCPGLGLLNYFLFLNNKKITIKDCIIMFIPTVIYTFILIPLNIAKVVTGPYPFLKVLSQPVWASILYTIGCWVAAFGINLLIKLICNKLIKNKEKKLKNNSI